ncbi:MAG: CBS domain-containing protein [Anaerohalosphaera sp.]|nr:CBS domain-containing protein [Anaerohalosphaera sp.]
MLKAKDILNFGVRTVQSDTPVYQAIATMASKRLNSLPVVDADMRLVGVISEKDVLELLYNFREGNVGDFMSDDPVSFLLDDSVEDICRCFANRNFSKVAILDNGKVVSVISRTDVINANKGRFQPKNMTKDAICNDPVFTAKDAMAFGLYTVRRETPIYEAVEIILKRGITGLPVVDDYMNLVGVVTEKDILGLIDNSQINAERVEDIMSEDVFTFDCRENLFDICDCLMNNNFRRVMILDHGKLAGIISRTDIISFIIKNKTAILKNRMVASQTN